MKKKTIEKNTADIEDGYKRLKLTKKTNRIGQS
jgi:hypothetical protein